MSTRQDNPQKVADTKISAVPSSVFKLTLFWRLFLSLLGVVLLTSVLSILVERQLTTQAIDQKMRKQVAYLTGLQSHLATDLSAGDIKAAEEVYREHRGLGHQIIVMDNSGAIILPKRRLKPPFDGAINEAKQTPNSASDSTIKPNATRDLLPQSLREGQGGNVGQEALNSLPTPTAGFLLSKPAEEALKAWRAGTDLPEMSVTLPDGNTAYIRLYPRLPFRDIMALQQGYMGLRLGLLLLFSVLVCYGLSRSLTGRIRTVQHRVHQLIQGNYTQGNEAYGSGEDRRPTKGAIARLGHDELGALAQDIATLSQRLTQSERARQQMLSDISHELRSPLSRLDVASELAFDIAKDQAPKSLPYLQRIQKESARLNTLIGQIIHIQSLQMGIGTGTPNKQRFDLVALIEQIGTDVCFEFQQKQIHWQITAPTSLMIDADEEQIHSAIENIIRNAFIHTPKEHRVSVTIDTINKDASTGIPSARSLRRLANTDMAKDSQALITIEDEGGGIDDDELEHIFEPFVRLDSARQRQTGGYGLGLAIARGVISAHGGKLSARNRDTGIRGLVIQVQLPLAP